MTAVEPSREGSAVAGLSDFYATGDEAAYAAFRARHRPTLERYFDRYSKWGSTNTFIEQTWYDVANSRFGGQFDPKRGDEAQWVLGIARNRVDAALFKAARERRSEEAMVELEARHRTSLVFWFAQHEVPDWVAEDLADDVLLRALHQTDSPFDPNVAPFSRWITTIRERVWITHWRKHVSPHAAPDDEAGPSPSTTTASARESRSVRPSHDPRWERPIEDHLDMRERLGEIFRQFRLLAAKEMGLTSREIARKHGITENAVNIRTHRERERLIRHRKSTEDS
jgi:DNA-directed RNA polymerase specialized sigma24 family protein